MRIVTKRQYEEERRELAALRVFRYEVSTMVQRAGNKPYIATLMLENALRRSSSWPWGDR